MARDKDEVSSDDLVGCLTVDIIKDVPIMKEVELTLPILNPRIQRKVRDSTLTIIVEKSPNDRAVHALSTIQEDRPKHGASDDEDVEELSDELSSKLKELGL